MKIVTIEEMRALERAADASGLSYDQMMENAGRAAAEAISERVRAGCVLILIGPGNNGGDGLVVARYLASWHYAVQVYIWKRDRAPDPNLDKVREMDIPVHCAAEDEGYAELEAMASRCDVVVDALLGTGATGSPRPPLDVAIDLLNRAPARRLAVDLPSGLDCDTGQPSPHTFRADHTCTFVDAKPGLAAEAAQPYVGQVHVLDIGVPRRIIAEAQCMSRDSGV